MAKPLRSQLNQIRAWVRQGRTDAWIAHQLEVSTSELREFRRRHELSADDEDSGEEDLRDEIEAEIEATMSESAAREEEDSDEESDDEDGDEDEGEARGSGRTRDGERKGDAEDGGDRPRRRRRRRRGGRAKRSGAGMQASFDHGKEGYGLWLDPAIADDPVYAENWADHRQVEVTVEPDRIVIRRTESDSGSEFGLRLRLRFGLRLRRLRHGAGSAGPLSRRGPREPRRARAARRPPAGAGRDGRGASPGGPPTPRPEPWPAW